MSKGKKLSKQSNDPVVKELEAIKRLLVLQLITSGVQSTHIAASLGVDVSTISRLVSMRRVKRPSKR